MPVPQDLTDRADLPEQRPGTADDLAGRLTRLPPGHPSSPVDETGSRRSPVPSLRDLELADDASQKPDQDNGQDRPAEPGEWHGEAGHFLSAADNGRIEAACDRIATIEKHLTRKLQEIEAQDPTRHLVGLANTLKGRDRLKEKVAEQLEDQPGLEPETAIALVPDAVRYTFQYHEASYSAGVSTDVVRLKAASFDLVAIRNFWSGAEYKGINSRWTDPDSGQLFEVQFHTEPSFDAKQLTHDAYEEIRTSAVAKDRAELARLHAYQRDISARVTEPPGAADIPNYP